MVETNKYRSVSHVWEFRVKTAHIKEKAKHYVRIRMTTEPKGKGGQQPPCTLETGFS